MEIQSTSNPLELHFTFIYFRLDPVGGVTMNSTDIDKTHHYWHTLLNMKVIENTESDLKLSYGDSQAFLAFNKIGKIYMSTTFNWVYNSFKNF